MSPELLTQTVLDFDRSQRIGLHEAVFCEGKSTAQIESILQQFEDRNQPALLTRLEFDKFTALTERYRERLDYDPLSRTAFSPGPLSTRLGSAVAIVSAGTSDAPVCREASRTIEFHGIKPVLFQDLGVAGLWRLTDRIDEIRRYPVVIAVAGMEGSIFSALGSLLGSVVIAVPTSVGYGVAEGGRLALHSALGSCVPGLLTVNIDNGYGGACAAIRLLNAVGALVQRQVNLE